ncbi:MAG: YbhB/YbcL family Raf kinase inhibitor-like protein [Candidatus Methanoperedens sp.]|nr:YbhB/YbcL family Raf kinase inhibitor-like protein [Candidatus Methanoperedens sp.]MCE8427780.1 YbhB/YbcL family Raf kinase inhibitor-like protein [Candidatus Methanoperedens sp.]
MQTISITTEAFLTGENIPSRYSCDGDDISPPLSWKGLPANANSTVLIMDDPDAPSGTFVHWVLFNIPAGTQHLPEGIPSDKILVDGSRHGMTDFGRAGYGGPCPPSGKQHRYFFRIYALDTKLDLSAGASRKQVESAMKGHVLAQGELMGKYGR